MEEVTPDLSRTRVLRDGVCQTDGCGRGRKETLDGEGRVGREGGEGEQEECRPGRA